MDSLVRIETFQWVTRIKSGRFFPPAFVVSKERDRTIVPIWHAEGTGCSLGKLNSISDFLQELLPPTDAGNDSDDRARDRRAPCLSAQRQLDDRQQKTFDGVTGDSPFSLYLIGTRRLITISRTYIAACCPDILSSTLRHSGAHRHPTPSIRSKFGSADSTTSSRITALHMISNNILHCKSLKLPDSSTAKIVQYAGSRSFLARKSGVGRAPLRFLAPMTRPPERRRYASDFRREPLASLKRALHGYTRLPGRAPSIKESSALLTLTICEGARRHVDLT